MPEWSVICLCADWCGTCRDYRLVFDAVTLQHPGIAFNWIDREDHADYLGGVDIETFPTVLVAQGNVARFFSPLPPSADVLSRLVSAFTAGSTAGIATAGGQTVLDSIIAGEPGI